MIIKSHTADATVGGQIVDRDFVQRLFEKKFFRDSARACLVIFDMGFLRLCVGFEVHISGFCHIYDKTLHGIVPVSSNCLLL